MIDILYTLSSTNYLILLVIVQIAILIFSILGAFNTGISFIVIRVIFLVMAQCCKQPSSAAFYSVLALMNGLYAFDPVGLFVTGHGQSRTFPANIFCILACVLAFFASYVGYLYKLSLQRQHGGQQQGGLNFLNNNQSPAYYNGNGNAYINPNDRIQNNPNPYSQPARRNFEPFQGQGHAIN